MNSASELGSRGDNTGGTEGFNPPPQTAGVSLCKALILHQAKNLTFDLHVGGEKNEDLPDNNENNLPKVKMEGDDETIRK